MAEFKSSLPERTAQAVSAPGERPAGRAHPAAPRGRCASAPGAGEGETARAFLPSLSSIACALTASTPLPPPNVRLPKAESSHLFSLLWGDSPFPAPVSCLSSTNHLLPSPVTLARPQRICEVYSRNPASPLEEQMEGARRRVTQLQRKIQQETGGSAVSDAGWAPGGCRAGGRGQSAESPDGLLELCRTLG